MPTSKKSKNKCSHIRTDLRRRRSKSDSVYFAHQCLDCGVLTRTVKADSILLGQQIITPWWDEGLQEKWKEAEEKEWRSRYEQHLASAKWSIIRARVMDRARSICEGCGKNAARDVHHLTYDRLGDEMLFDLVAVCTVCHDKLHPWRNGRRK